MPRITHIKVRKRRPDWGTGLAILVMLGFIVAAFLGHTPSWLQ